MNLREVPSRNQRSVSSSLSQGLLRTDTMSPTSIADERQIILSNAAIENADRTSRFLRRHSARRDYRRPSRREVIRENSPQVALRNSGACPLLAADEGCDDTSFYVDLCVEEFRPVIRHHTICLQSHDMLIGAEPYGKVPAAKYRSLMTTSNLVVDLRVRVPLIFHSFQSPYVPNRIGMQYPY